MDAKQARIEAEAVESTKVAAQLVSVKAKIEHNAREGVFQIRWNGELNARVMRILESDGFTIQLTKDSEGHQISW